MTKTSAYAPPAERPGHASIWPAPARPASPRLLLRVGLAGLAVAALLPSRPGLNMLLIGLAVLAALAPVAPRTRTSALFALLTMALLALPVLRDAGWLVSLVVVLSIPLGSYALLGGRTWTELLGGGIVLPFTVPHVLPWAGRGMAEVARSRRGPGWPLVRSLLIAAGLLVFFGALLVQADAAFGAIIGSLVPELSVWSLLSRVLLFPIAALDLLFLCFAAVQADVLLASDKDELLEGTGLSYAEYARQGFWQLLLVTGLVLAVIAVAVRYAPLAGARDRALVRVSLGLLCALTLVIVAVALRRLYLYEEAYGYTRLRVWVHAFELWMGVVIVLIAAAGIRWKATWLPRAVAASGAGGLLALGLFNPDGFIAARNVDHASYPVRADLSYLSGLSADAVPALDRLPEPRRSCALRHLADDLRRPDPWPSVNLSRAKARALLADRPVLPDATC